MSLPIRPGSRRNQARGPSRASAAGLVVARALGLAGVIASAGLLALLSVGGLFAAGPSGLEVRGARYTSRSAIATAVGLEAGDRLDLTTLHTARLAARLRALPAVDTAAADPVEVRVVLPDRLVVTIRERQPILIWSNGRQRFLADTAGLLFARLPETAGSVLPIVHDERAAAADLSVGSQLDPVAFAAVRRLAAIRPATVGSQAPSLSLALTDEAGFTLSAPGGWQAVFGLYTMAIRPPSTVERQVQCLTSLLGAVGEGKAAVVYLSPAGDACGTYTTVTGKS